MIGPPQLECKLQKGSAFCLFTDVLPASKLFAWQIVSTLQHLWNEWMNEERFFLKNKAKQNINPQNPVSKGDYINIKDFCSTVQLFNEKLTA